MRRSTSITIALVALLAACDGNSAPPDFPDPTLTPSSSITSPSETSSPGATDSPSEALPSDVDTLAPSDGPTSYGDYTTITDDSEALQMDVPVAWGDVSGAATDIGPGLSAAPDLAAFTDDWETSGVIFIASREVGTDIDALLERYAYDECTADEANDYSDGEYTGKSQIATDCGETSTGTITIAATKDDDPELAVIVFVQLAAAADQEAVERIQRTFRVIGDVS